MANPVGRLEFGVACLGDIRYLLKVWHELLVREMLESNESSLVHVLVEDRRPGEEVKLCFMAAQEVLHRFLQFLDDRGLKFNCNEIIPGILTICRIIRDRGVMEVISPKGGGG
jgi:hypothetical protein